VSSRSPSEHSHQFVPSLEGLEQRVAPASLADVQTALLFFGAGNDTVTLSLIASQLALPRTGGVALQVGSTLGLELAADPPVASAAIFTDGLGDVAMAWDGGPFHFFSGVSNLNVFSQAPANVVALDVLAPLQAPLSVNLEFVGGPFNALFEHAAGGAALGVGANTPLATLSF
jgi:hypothetical protein